MMLNDAEAAVAMLNDLKEAYRSEEFQRQRGEQWESQGRWQGIHTSPPQRGSKFRTAYVKVPFALALTSIVVVFHSSGLFSLFPELRAEFAALLPCSAGGLFNPSQVFDRVVIQQQT